MTSKSASTNTRELSKAKRRPRKIQRPRGVPIATTKTFALGESTSKAIMNISLSIGGTLMTIKRMITNLYAMSVRVMIITMTGIHAAMMTKDTPRTRTNAKTARRVSMKHITLKMSRTKD